MRRGEAVRAVAVEGNDVAAGDEALGEEGLEVGGGGEEGEDAAAAMAEEVMVVGEAAAFVAAGLAGEVNGFDPAGFEEEGDVAVDGGETDTGAKGAEEGEDFGDRERGRVAIEEVAEDLELAGFAMGGGCLGHVDIALSVYAKAAGRRGWVENPAEEACVRVDIALSFSY